MFLIPYSLPCRDYLFTKENVHYITSILILSHHSEIIKKNSGTLRFIKTNSKISNDFPSIKWENR